MYRDETPDVKFQEKVDTLEGMIDNYDKQMLSYIGRLYEAVNNEKLDFDKVKNAVDALRDFDAKEQYNYLDNLLHPEKKKGVKIPSAVPVPSNAFQLHNSVTLTTNSSGNMVFIFNPYFLYDKDNLPTYKVANQVGGTDTCTMNYCTSLAVYNRDDLTGSSVLANNQHFWNYINVGQGIPNVYSQYRLVSASIVVKYIGRMDIASGVIGGAIIFDESKDIMGTHHSDTQPTANFKNIARNLDKYTNFDIAMDSFYHQENLAVEGLRQLYFPVDNSYEEYTKTFTSDCIDRVSLMPLDADNYHIVEANNDYYKGGFNFMVYTLGAPASSACFKLDVYCNFECLPNPEFLNYMPISPSPMCISSYEKRQAIKTVQEQPIMKASDYKDAEKVPSIWQKLKRKFKNSLPGIGQLVKNGIINFLPNYKSMISTGNAIVSAMMDTD